MDATQPLDFPDNSFNLINGRILTGLLLQPFLAKVGVATQEELEYLHDQMEKEFQAEDFCGLDYHLTVWGRKG